MSPEIRELVRRCRHPLEMKLFAVAAVLTLAAFVLALGASFFQTELIDSVRESTVAEYRVAHPADAALAQDEVLKKLSGEEREMLDVLEWLYWPIVLLAPLGMFFLIVGMVGRIYGELRTDGVQIGPSQFPEVWALWSEMAREMHLDPVPDLFVKNGNGQLNAFATCVPGWRAFSAVYSDILERCVDTKDWTTLRFVLGHELGHIRMNHVRWWYVLLTMATNVPVIQWVIGQPLSRAREYGCDKIGYRMAGDGACQSALLLAAGKHLYGKVNFQQYLDDHVHRRSLWDSVFNLSGDHPVASWRVRALVEKRAGHLYYSGGTTRPDPQ